MMRFSRQLLMFALSTASLTVTARSATATMLENLAPVQGNKQSNVFQGATFGFPLPLPPYSPDDRQFGVSIGYGDAASTISDNVLHDSPTSIDLSNHPNLAGFLLYACNGISDTLVITTWDRFGNTKSSEFAFAFEYCILGSYPYLDLAGQNVYSLQLNIVYITESDIAINLKTIVPEPETWAMASLSFVLAMVLHRWRSCIL